jgi:KaiC/GvpD/RAD55 family RecA-like ATPase
MNYYATGLPALDDRLGGGLPAGSVAVLEVPASSAGTLVPPAFASVTGRPTVYVTTDRHPDQIETDIAAAVASDVDGVPDQPTDHVAITEFDAPDSLSRPHGHRGNAAEPAPAAEGEHPDADETTGGATDSELPALPESVSEIVTSATGSLNEVDSDPEPTSTTDHRPGPFCLVLDSISPLIAAEQGTWEETFQTIQQEVTEVGGLALVVLLQAATKTLDEQRLLHRADAVLQYQPAGSEERDRLVVRRVSGVNDDADSLPLNLEVRVSDHVHENPDSTFH